MSPGAKVAHRAFEISNMFLTFHLLIFLIENHPEKTKTSATVCEGKSHKISCQGKQKIEITASDYGRTSKEVCPSFFNLNTNCHSENALEITKKECDGYKECTLHANNDEYGEPCFGTSKYLTVCPQ